MIPLFSVLFTKLKIYLEFEYGFINKRILAKYLDMRYIKRWSNFDGYLLSNIWWEIEKSVDIQC